jgi:hypothetical protein
MNIAIGKTINVIIIIIIIIIVVDIVIVTQAVFLGWDGFGLWWME